MVYQSNQNAISSDILQYVSHISAKQLIILNDCQSLEHRFLDSIGINRNAGLFMRLVPK